MKITSAEQFFRNINISLLTDDINCPYIKLYDNLKREFDNLYIYDTERIICYLKVKDSSIISCILYLKTIYINPIILDKLLNEHTPQSSKILHEIILMYLKDNYDYIKPFYISTKRAFSICEFEAPRRNTFLKLH